MIYIKDGKLLIDNAVVEIDYLEFINELSRGANGIVFLARDPVLGREVVVKIWVKLRTKDIRNKKVQGQYEARKIYFAKETLSDWHDPKLDSGYFLPDQSDIITIPEKLIAQVYYVGYYKEYFYAVMEYIQGVTLKDFLTKRCYEEKTNCDNLLYDENEKRSCTSNVPFGVKAYIALKLANYNKIFIDKGCVHGDLHWKNIMISNYIYNDQFYHTYDIRILDFGTSYYTGKAMSIKRSFTTLIQTIDQCIYPFCLKDIQASKEPEDKDDASGMTGWIIKQLYALRAAFYELGEEYVGWPLYRAFGTYAITTKGFGIDTSNIKKLIMQNVQSGKIELSMRFLGVSKDWDSFDGRTAKRGD